MKKFILVFTIGVVVLCVACAPARAELITIAISGQVTDVSDQYNHFGGQIHVGTPITGTYTCDIGTSDLYPLDSTNGQYWYYTSPNGISLNVGEFNFKTNPSNVEFAVELTKKSYENDYFLISYHNLPLLDGTPVEYIDWHLYDPTGTALSSDALPLTAPDLGKWGYNSLNISTDRTFGISATITSAVLVPEPATILLFGLGLLLTKRIH